MKRKENERNEIFYLPITCFLIINTQMFGKKIIVSESEVFSRFGDSEKLVAKAMVTLMAIVLTHPDEASD